VDKRCSGTTNISSNILLEYLVELSIEMSELRNDPIGNTLHINPALVNNQHGRRKASNKVYLHQKNTKDGEVFRRLLGLHGAPKIDENWMPSVSSACTSQLRRKTFSTALENESSQGPPRTPKKLESPKKLLHSRIQFEKRVTKSRQANEQRQFPLSSAVLYWRDWPNERVLPDEVSLRTIFARYGRVRSVVMTSENSAVVVFEDLRDCCDLIQASDIQVLLDKTVLLVKATWYHRPLQNRDFYRAGGALATVMKRPITY